ncbi:cytochrome P450 [Russula earlei]|uniref:Cytochrome P450 n=1 Tax=Russula earlei TaxID=71964 RepID=A0ACC0U1C1_9AGAM|nr:cytochrome P450 [Russula earlei]
MHGFTPITVLDILAGAAFVALIASFKRRRQWSRLPLPPGPRGLPIIGHFLTFPKNFVWLTFTEWGQKHGMICMFLILRETRCWEVTGDIVSVQILGQVIVVLNSPKVAKDLLEKRANIYSDRHLMPFYQMMGWEWFHPTTPYGDYWREGRKLLDRSLRAGAVVQYRPMQLAKTHDLLYQLLMDPESFQYQIELYQAKLLMSLVYGYDVKSYNDRLLVVARKMAELGSAVLPGTVLVNEIPILKHIPAWIPWLSYQPAAQAGFDAGQDVLRYPMEFVKDGFKNGTARPSLALENLQDIERMRGPQRENAEEVLKGVLGSMYTAGSDSTALTIIAFFRILVLYPEVQTRAQKELDAVTGGLRLPDYNDRPRLPYIDALCKEVMRWSMATPVGVPHATIQDDIYEGYLIPKGAIVIANAWGMLHDPTAYPEPFAFKPERFLDADGTFRDDPLLTSAFGFGRRLCPARHFVDSSLFLSVSCVLSVFRVGPPKDELGNEIHVEIQDSGTNSSRPVGFRCTIVARDDRAKELIIAANMAG